MARSRDPHDSGLVLRVIVAIALWSYAGWYAGALVAVSAGLPDWIGPLAGVLTAALVTYDWRRPRVRRRAPARLPRVEEQPQQSG